MPDGITSNIFYHAPREPIDTNKVVHEIADNWFFRKFGVKGRSNTIICSTDPQQAQAYCQNEGSVAEIIPVDGSQFLYSPVVRDFLNYLTEARSTSEDDICDWLGMQNYQLIRSISSLPMSFKGEVMLYCENYILKNI